MKRLELDVHLISISRLRSGDPQPVSEIAFRGSIRKKTEESFRTYLNQAGERAPFLIVDLSETEYINSAGLGVLLEQSRLQEQRGGWVRITHPSETVAMILSLSGVADILPVCSDSDEAIADLPSKAA